MSTVYTVPLFKIIKVSKCCCLADTGFSHILILLAGFLIHMCFVASSGQFDITRIYVWHFPLQIETVGYYAGYNFELTTRGRNRHAEQALCPNATGSDK